MLHRLQLNRDTDGIKVLDDQGEALPPLPKPLLLELVAWLEARPWFATGDDSRAAKHFAWEDQGMDLGRRLDELWGPEYAVRTFA